MDQYKNIDPEEQEIEIDWVKLAKKIWSQRKLIYKVCGIAIVVALIIAFSIPKRYTTTVILAPEVGSAKGGNMGQLAALAGVDMQNQNMQDLSPQVYPDIIKATPFLSGLFNIPVKDSQQQIDTSLYTYLNEYQKSAWWSFIISLPFKLLGLFSSTQELAAGTENSGTMVISKEQSVILEALKGSINVIVDKKTGVITLTSVMQSPVISASIADTITSYMQDYIISYRTQKARKDLHFSETLYLDAKDKYYKAQQTYATYTDANAGIISASYRTTQERLQNEMNLAYGIYNQMAQQLQMAKVKVQDMTPVYTIVQPAVVPLKASSPRKLLILIGITFLAFVGVCGWIVKDDLFQAK